LVIGSGAMSRIAATTTNTSSLNIYVA